MGTAQGRPTTGTTDGGIRALEIRGAFADGFAPHYSSAEAAGADLYAMVPEPLELLPGQRIAIPTGVRLEIPKGYEGQVRPSPHHPLSRFQIKEARAVEYQLNPWRIANDPEREGWMELFIDMEVLTEVRSSGGDPYDD